MYNHINKIISESIDRLLVEEFGIIDSLEPFCDYLIERFFNKLISGNGDNISFAVDMNWVTKHIHCENWYGIDGLNRVILRTTIGGGADASLDFDTDSQLMPEIVINLRGGFSSREVRQYLRSYDQKVIFEEFYSRYKPSIMHELTHLIEVVNTWGNYKYPAYAYMKDGDFENQGVLNAVGDVSFAFSKTEMNARVTTVYYMILNDRRLRNTIIGWGGKRTDLCKYLIDSTNKYNWINNIKKYLSIVKMAMDGKDKRYIDFARNFININKLAAFSGSKNIFKFKYSANPNNKEEMANWDDSDENVLRMLPGLYDKMYKMYYKYLKKLYEVADLAIDDVKNKQITA